MNLSKYTLVSFGDSFTFGQDIVQEPPLNLDSDSRFIKEKLYKEECNDKAYTQVVADRLGFKDSINFGVLAGSNDRSIANLESFLRNNPKKKVFVLFNFTVTSRYIQFFKIDGEDKYELVNISNGFFSKVVNTLTESKKPDSFGWKYTGINQKSLAQNWTFFRNNIQDVYNHIKQRRAVYYILSSYNVPYVTFDVLNDMDYRILRDNPLQYISNSNIDGCYSYLLYNDDESYVFKEADFLNSYYEELVNNTPLLTHITIDKLNKRSCVNGHIINKSRNVYGYIINKGKKLHNDEKYYMSDNHGPETGHWNSEGHIEVAKLIEKFINERYK